MKNGEPTLVNTIFDDRVEKDFTHYYLPSDTFDINNAYCGINKIPIRNGILEIYAIVDGCHACQHGTAIMK
jgi:hypothetical protein